MRRLSTDRPTDDDRPTMIDRPTDDDRPTTIDRPTDVIDPHIRA
jgi:hypothetical protein